MSPDYKKTLNLLNEINSVKIDNKPINSFFIYKGFDFWGIYQMSLFSDFKKPEKKESEKIRNRSFYKKISIFIKDSVLKILMLTESVIALIIKNPDIFLYTLDKTSSNTALNDARIDEVYKFLKKENISYLEIMHTVPSMDTFKNFLKRKRFVVYLEAFTFLPKLSLNLKNLQSQDKVFENKIKKYDLRFSLSKRLVKIFTFIFKWKRPKALWGIDDTRNIHEFIIAAKDAKVPSYLFQHGHFTKYHVGWLKYDNQIANIPYADNIVVWNEYWKKELIRLGTYYPEKNILVGGLKDIAKNNLNNSLEKDVSVLIPYETDAPKEEIRKFIQKLKSENIKIYLKIRKDISSLEQVKEYTEGIENISGSENNVIIPVTELVPATACLGVYSSFLYDVIDIYPIGILKTGMDYGYGMIENKVAEEVVLEKPLREQILNLKKHSLGDDKKLLSDTLYDIAKTCGI